MRDRGLGYVGGCREDKRKNGERGGGCACNALHSAIISLSSDGRRREGEGHEWVDFRSCGTLEKARFFRAANAPVHLARQRVR